MTPDRSGCGPARTWTCEAKTFRQLAESWPNACKQAFATSRAPNSAASGAASGCCFARNNSNVRLELSLTLGLIYHSWAGPIGTIDGECEDLAVRSTRRVDSRPSAGRY